MNISQFWQLPPQEQNEVILELRTPPGLAVEPHPKPGGYDCPCRLADANYCYDDTHDVEINDGMNGTCECSCHSDCGGEW